MFPLSHSLLYTYPTHMQIPLLPDAVLVANIYKEKHSVPNDRSCVYSASRLFVSSLSLYLLLLFLPTVSYSFSFSSSALAAFCSASDFCSVACSSLFQRWCAQHLLRTAVVIRDYVLTSCFFVEWKGTEVIKVQIVLRLKMNQSLCSTFLMHIQNVANVVLVLSRVDS